MYTSAFVLLTFSALGGTVSSMYTSKTTHVVASGSIRNSTDYQLRRAAAENVTIVPPAFVAKKLQDHKDANPHFGSPTPTPAPAHTPTTSTTTGGKSLTVAQKVPQYVEEDEEDYDEEEWREQLLDLSTTSSLNPTVTEVIPATGPVTGNTRVCFN